MGHIYPSVFPYRPCLPRRGIAWRRALHVARSSLPLPHPHAARSPRLPLSPTACFLPLSPAPLHQTLRPSPSLRLPTRHLPVASSAAPSGAAASATERPRFLERCGLNADEFDDDAEAEPMVGLFGRSIRGLAEVNFTAVSGGLSVFLFVCFQEERRRGRPSSWLDLVSPCSAVAATSSPLSWPPHPPPKKSPTAGFIGDGDDAQ
uniref:Uncharacterized protein n=1 Tax=Oryza barthii TaxID=65489 RepID=A0A0D3GYH5_9ORYZ